MSAPALEALRDFAAAGRLDRLRAGLAARFAEDPEDAQTHALAAWLAQIEGRGADCDAHLARAAAALPEDPGVLSLRLARAEARGEAAAATEIAARWLAVHPESPEAQYAVARRALADGERGERPRALLDAALARDPGFVDAWLLRAWQAHADGDFAAAAAAAERACALAPGRADAWLERARAELRRYRGEAARAAFESALRIAPETAEAWRGLAQALELLGEGEAALAAWERWRARVPGAASDLMVAQALARQGENESAADVASRSAARAPDRLLAHWLSFQLLPLVHADDAAVSAARRRWRDGLAAFSARLDPPPSPESAREVLTAMPSFHRHYLGDDLLADQRAAGRVVQALAARCFAPAPPAPPRRARWRVGFASAHLRRHTVWKLFHRWLADLDRTRFEVVAVTLGPVPDATTAALGAIADRVLGPLHEAADWVAALEAERLDALIWLDIGMDGLTQLLAPLRFAPLQAAAWGHPVTPALDAIDLFLSGAAMEPPDGEAHYAERLVRLPGLGIRYPLPEAARHWVRPAPDPSRPVRFLCPQSVHKLLPVHDALFARVLAAVPGSTLTLIPHPSARVRARLAARMRPAFAACGVDLDARVRLLAYRPEPEFLRALQTADVLLDSLDWSGGNTTLEALAFDLPVVTLPGAFMRGRHTAAMLDILGLADELVARDRDDYVAIAARLGTDAEARARLAAAIAARKGALFDDPAPVVALAARLEAELVARGV